MGALTVLAAPDRPAQLNGAAPGQTAQDFKLMSWYGMAREVFGQEYLEDLCNRQLRRVAGVATHEGISGDLRSSKPSGLSIWASRSARTWR